jgi:hypothetical protein
VNLEWATGGGRLSGLKEFCSVVITFCFIVTGWIFFRAETIGHALKYFAGICSPSLFSIPRFTMAKMDFGSAIMSIFILLVVEWINRESAFGLSRPVQNRVIRWIGYIILVFLIAELGGSQQEFIYFQF